MSKKLIALSICIVLIAVIFVACGKDKLEPVPDDSASIGYTTDADGNQFVTNINGELIPVTTGKDGSVELIGDLVTKTKAQADKEKEEIEKGENGGNGGNGENSGNGGGNEENKPTETTTTNSNGIVIGNDNIQDNDSHDAVIDWSNR